MKYHIKIIQEACQDIYYNIPQPMIVDKGKQKENRIQDKKIFLYKPYSISSELNKPKTPKPTFVQNKVNNLEKYIKFLQAQVKTTSFYPLLYYTINLFNQIKNKTSSIRKKLPLNS